MASTQTAGNGGRINGESLAMYLLHGRLDHGGSTLRVPGLVPFMDSAVVESFFEPTLRDVLVKILGRSSGVDVAEVLVQRKEIHEHALRDLVGALRAEYQRVIDAGISIEKLRESYQEVVHKVIDKALQDNAAEIAQGHPPLFTEKMSRALKEGQIVATEDFKRFLEDDKEAFYREVVGLEGEKLNNKMLRSVLFEQAVKEFQARFDPANIMLLDLLGLRDHGETDSVLNKRIEDRLSEAIRFLDTVHKSAHTHQLRNSASASSSLSPGQQINIFASPSPEDLAWKRVFDLAETLYYAGSGYATGKERKFIAQQILVLALLYNKIHQWPQFMAAREVSRRLNNSLNYNFDPEVGRAGVEVKGVFVDKNDVRSTARADENFALMGLKMFKLCPLIVYNDESKETDLLFENGADVMINGRVKSADSTVLKYLNKGDLDKIHDLVAFEFVIDERGMAEQDFLQRVRDLKRYIKRMWNVETFFEDSTNITGDNSAVSELNPVSSNQFKVEKVVFYKAITMADGQKITVPIEVQIKSLETKLKSDSATGEVAHSEYETRRAMRLFTQLFPEEVFGPVARIAREVAVSAMSE